MELATTGGFKIPLSRSPRLPRHLALSGFVPLSDSNEFAYLLDISFGGQDFQLMFDTGSSDLWVVSQNCTASDCEGVPRYNDTSSLSLTNDTFQLQYVEGEVSGGIGAETVALGSFEIIGQVFALVSMTSGLDLSGTGNSGILGLSFPSVASISSMVGRTFLENVLSPFNASTQYFAYKLGREQDDSSFTIGQLDTTYANSSSDWAFYNVSSAGGEGYNYWKLPFQHMTVNGTAFELSPTRVQGSDTNIAVLDSGTTLILGPSEDVDRLWTSIGQSRKTGAGWQVQCNRGIMIGFVLGENGSQHEYVLDPTDVAWDEAGQEDGWCLGGIQSNDGVNSGDWLLGDSFLRNVYTTHHAQTAGSPPMIGLLGLTDTNTSLASFQRERGTDPNPPATVLSYPTQRHAISGADICGIAVGAGWIAGTAITLLILCIWQPNRRKGKGNRY